MFYGEFLINGYWDVFFFKFLQGVILNNDLFKVYDVNYCDNDEIWEFVNNFWYDYIKGDEEFLYFWEGEIEINYFGLKLLYDYLDIDKKYSFIKILCWKGLFMEVGLLFCVLVGYVCGNEEIKVEVDVVLKYLDVLVEVLFFILGCMVVCGICVKLIVNWGLEFYDQMINNIKNGDIWMVNIECWELEIWLVEVKGVGYMEVLCGVLGYWIKIKDGKIENYQ